MFEIKRKIILLAITLPCTWGFFKNSLLKYLKKFCLSLDGLTGVGWHAQGLRNMIWGYILETDLQKIALVQLICQMTRKGELYLVLGEHR